MATSDESSRTPIPSPEPATSASPTTTTSEHGVIRTKQYGHPGGYAAILASRARTIALLAFVSSFTLALVGLGAPNDFPSLQQAPWRGFCIALSTLLAILGQRPWVQALKAERGSQSEKRVARALRRHHCYTAVLHSVLLGSGGDADHVVLGPCAAVVETKTGHGKIRADKAGRLHAGSRTLPGNPTTQVLRQASALAARLDGPVTSIVCIVDAVSVPSSVRGVLYCNLDSLPALLDSLPAVVNASEALSIASTLAAESKVAEKARRSTRRRYLSHVSPVAPLSDTPTSPATPADSPVLDESSE